MTNTDKSRQRLSALDKSMLVLQSIAGQSQAIGLPDLTARLDLPRQTLHRVLQQLEQMELIVKEPGRERFAVGPAFIQLSLNALNSENQGAPVRGILRSLVDDIGETCNLGILRGSEFQYIERVECDWSLRVLLPSGARVPAHCTAGGKLMLAHMSESLRSGILYNTRLKRFTDHTLTTRRDLEAEFDLIREQGYALNQEEYSTGTIGIAVPVRDASQNVLAGLALHTPTARMSIEHAISLVKRLENAAKAIEQCWGLG